MIAKLEDLPSRTMVWFNNPSAGISLYYILPKFPGSDGKLVSIAPVGHPNLVKEGFVAFTAEERTWHLELPKETEVEVLQAPAS